MPEKYVILKEETGEMLSEIFIRRENGYIAQGTTWTKNKDEALNLEFAEMLATIQFIQDVISWEEAEDLGIWRI